MDTRLSEKIFAVNTDAEFEQLALQVFHNQVANCAIYAKFVTALNVNSKEVDNIAEIPFLPVEFFKSQQIVCGNAKAGIIFTSSGTTGMSQSRHYVTDAGMYEQSFRRAFDIFYGDIKQYAILALLPSYTERNGSSLIYMVDELISNSKKPQSGYFLYNHNELYSALLDLKQQGVPTMLIGVTHALLDFVESYTLTFPGLIVMETGGMKGRRKEMIRREVHTALSDGFGVTTIHSEYGMTELLSQAYSKGNGIFHTPPWMRILIRDTNDPLGLIEPGKTGGVNIIDLANINSCSFIATQDLGKLNPDKSFEVLGRFDNSDIRGCNLLVQ